jgi:hypothetical protein
LAAKLQFEDEVELGGGHAFVSEKPAVVGVGMFQEVEVVGWYVCFCVGSYLIKVDSSEVV